MFSKYGKALAAVLGAILVAAQAALFGDHHISAEETVRIAIGAVMAIGVYLVPLVPQYRWAKTAVAVLLAALQVMVTVVLGGIDSAEWMAIVIAGLTAAGVAVSPAISGNGISSTSPTAPPRLSTR